MKKALLEVFSYKLILVGITISLVMVSFSMIFNYATHPTIHAAAQHDDITPLEAGASATPKIYY